MKIADLPSLNAVLNGISFTFLLLGFYYIKNDQRQKHKLMMICALISSALFLISYLVYHAHAGSVPYPYHDWSRLLYFIILVPHILLAAVMVPFILAAVIFALRGNFTRHVRLVRWVWPVWIYVSLSGVLIYLMLYKF